jgi:hypothetical protein
MSDNNSSENVAERSLNVVPASSYDHHHASPPPHATYQRCSCGELLRCCAHGYDWVATTKTCACGVVNVLGAVEMRGRFDGLYTLQAECCLQDVPGYEAKDYYDLMMPFGFSSADWEG